MTTSSNHLATLRAMFDAIAAGNVQALADMQAPGFALNVSGTSSVSGHFPGDAAVEQFGRSMELTAGQMEIEPTCLLAGDDVGIAIVTVRASRPDGRFIEQRLIHEIRFQDGKIAELDEWVWDQAADVAFWR